MVSLHERYLHWIFHWRIRIYLKDQYTNIILAEYTFLTISTTHVNWFLYYPT